MDEIEKEEEGTGSRNEMGAP